jgi:hypothetical protein
MAIISLVSSIAGVLPANPFLAAAVVVAGSLALAVILNVANQLVGPSQFPTELGAKAHDFGLVVPGILAHTEGSLAPSCCLSFFPRHWFDHLVWHGPASVLREL